MSRDDINLQINPSVSSFQTPRKQHMNSHDWVFDPIAVDFATHQKGNKCNVGNYRIFSISYCRNTSKSDNSSIYLPLECSWIRKAMMPIEKHTCREYK
jgi:hypothetical protein